MILTVEAATASADFLVEYLEATTYTGKRARKMGRKTTSSRNTYRHLRTRRMRRFALEWDFTRSAVLMFPLSLNPSPLSFLE